MLVGVSTEASIGASPTTQHSTAKYMGKRGPLAHRTQVSHRSARSALPTPGDAIGSLEIKSTEVKARRNSPQGGSAVLNGNVRPPTVASVPVTQSPGGVTSSFEGLNHFDSRYSGGGNQFSGEPPDQGLCVGGDYVFEVVNSVVQVFTKAGSPLIAGNKRFPAGPSVGLTLNEFYKLPPTFVRPSGPFGPNMFDPACLFDPTTNRWFVTSANLDENPVTGAFTGDNQIWLAVSETDNPLGAWRIWSIDTTNNGAHGSPDHHCAANACFGDYPQIGIDANGLYITTNEFEFFGDGFNGAQVYALSKADLVAGGSSPTMQVFQNVHTATYNDSAYTLQPVNALPAEWATNVQGGTMYFGMSGSPFTTGLAKSIVLYGLTNTSSLNTDSPQLALAETSTPTQAYATPGFAQQKDGPTPLLDCINSFSCIGVHYPNIAAPNVLDAGNSGKVYGAWLHHGDVYLTTGTPLTGSGAAWYNTNNGNWKGIKQRTGVAWFVLHPAQAGTLSAPVTRQGYVAVQGANLTYPSIVVGPTGAGAIGATLTGPNDYPSAAVSRFRPGLAPASVQVTGAGVGPNDGFTATGEGGYDPRWGDYPAATVTPDGTMWLANEYIASRCTDAEFAADTTCGYRRSFYANWSTHITAVAPLS